MADSRLWCRSAPCDSMQVVARWAHFGARFPAVSKTNSKPIWHGRGLGFWGDCLRFADPSEKAERRRMDFRFVDWDYSVAII